MIMEPMPYMLTLHYMVLAMRDIKFPHHQGGAAGKSGR